MNKKNYYVMKVDVEGHECSALISFQKLLKEKAQAKGEENILLAFMMEYIHGRCTLADRIKKFFFTTSHR